MRGRNNALIGNANLFRGKAPENIAHRRRGCSLSRVGVNGVIIHLRPGGRPGILGEYITACTVGRETAILTRASCPGGTREEGVRTITNARKKQRAD